MTDLPSNPAFAHGLGHSLQVLVLSRAHGWQWRNLTTWKCHAAGLWTINTVGHVSHAFLAVIKIDTDVDSCHCRKALFALPSGATVQLPRYGVRLYLRSRSELGMGYMCVPFSACTPCWGWTTKISWPRLELVVRRKLCISYVLIIIWTKEVAIGYVDDFRSVSISRVWSIGCIVLGLRVVVCAKDLSNRDNSRLHYSFDAFDLHVRQRSGSHLSLPIVQSLK